MTRHIQFSWKEGMYLDLWSVVHFITGLIFAAVFSAISDSFWLGFVILAFFTILYEFAEYAFKVREHIQNADCDVVFALCAFAIYFSQFSGWDNAWHWKAFALTVFVNLILTLLGYRAYR